MKECPFKFKDEYKDYFEGNLIIKSPEFRCDLRNGNRCVGEDKCPILRRID